MDARCLLRSIDVAAARKSSSKLGYFQSATPSTLSGLCIHRKAINKDKHSSSHRPAKVSTLQAKHITSTRKHSGAWRALP